MATTTDLSWVDRLPDRAGAAIKNQAKDVAGMLETSARMIAEGRKLAAVARRNARQLERNIADIWPAEDIAAAKKAAAPDLEVPAFLRRAG